MPLVGGFSRGYPVSPSPSFRSCSIFTSITLIDSQDLAVKSHPNLFNYTLTFNRDRGGSSAAAFRITNATHSTGLQLERFRRLLDEGVISTRRVATPPRCTGPASFLFTAPRHLTSAIGSQFISPTRDASVTIAHQGHLANSITSRCEATANEHTAEAPRAACKWHVEAGSDVEHVLDLPRHHTQPVDNTVSQRLSHSAYTTVYITKTTAGGGAPPEAGRWREKGRPYPAWESAAGCDDSRRQDVLRGPRRLSGLPPSHCDDDTLYPMANPPHAQEGRQSCKETCIAAERDWAAMTSNWGHDHLPNGSVNREIPNGAVVAQWIERFQVGPQWLSGNNYIKWGRSGQVDRAIPSGVLVQLEPRAAGGATRSIHLSFEAGQAIVGVNSQEGPGTCSTWSVRYFPGCDLVVLNSDTVATHSRRRVCVNGPAWLEEGEARTRLGNVKVQRRPWLCRDRVGPVLLEQDTQGKPLTHLSPGLPVSARANLASTSSSTAATASRWRRLLGCSILARAEPTAPRTIVLSHCLSLLPSSRGRLLQARYDITPISSDQLLAPLVSIRLATGSPSRERGFAPSGGAACPPPPTATPPRSTRTLGTRPSGFTSPFAIPTFSPRRRSF
ncbi:hypothetical protein PR048_008803 [Dryococelus australis]|uniref:Uncharacterized protein n=1 Tax=Dryococelus australis TaxID=614101 RepID=A0ABQ9HY46_9NEOP|nr:hypothetical protein PR048_008803 [Dryococelus australis]